MFVRTVRDDIDIKELGPAHCHEHLFVFPTDGVSLPQRLIADDFERSKEEVERFRNVGGRTLVDAQPFAAGRNAELLYRLSGETDVHIIASTGLHKKMFYPAHFWSELIDTQDLAELFISEIEDGMYGYNFSDPFGKQSSIRAGLIKIAAESAGPVGDYRKVFEAAVRAHSRTGAPIMTHTELSQGGMKQVEFLIEGGVRPASIIVSHMDRVIDTAANLELARLGVYLEYDTIARLQYHSNNMEVELIGSLVEEGLADRILLGMDTTRDRMLSYGGSFGLEYIQKVFIKKLKEYGIAEKYIRKFMVENPQHALSFKKL